MAAVGTTPLSDGQYFGFISSADPDHRTVTFDVAQWFGGEDAKRASVADGHGSEVPNDYYIRNVNTYKRVVPVACGSVVTVIRCLAQCGTFSGTWTGFATAINTITQPPDLQARYRGKFGSYWLTVRNHDVVRIDEQFRP